MCSIPKWLLAAGLVLCLNIVPALGEEQDAKEKMPAAAAGEKAAAELLAGVVHLSDDDIRFRTKDGTCIFVDPVNGPDNKPAAASGMTKPDLILITHSHGDHFQPDVIQAYLKINPKAIVAGPNDVVKQAGEKGISQTEMVKPNQKYTMAGVDFNTAPSCFLKPENGHPRANQWVGYVLHLDGANYYVTGDTETLPQMASIKPDVIFPLLSGCGGNLDDAVKMTFISKARVAVPVHFHSGPGELGAEEETVKKYLAKMPRGVQSAYYKDGKLIVTP